MKHHRDLWHALMLSSALVLSGVSVVQPVGAQELFVGDGGNNGVNSAIAHFDVSNGKFLGDFVPPNGAGLHGPNGMIFTSGELVVVNQNVNLPLNGELLRFDGETGTFIGKLVAASYTKSPFLPRGIVRGGPGNLFYVADLGLSNGCPTPGDVKVYDENGVLQYNLDHTLFPFPFYPRGVVFGPDGLLYVSAVGCDDTVGGPGPNVSAGYILRFDVQKRAFVDVLASTATVRDLHRPEGLVFDRDGNLWVTSFRIVDDKNDTDKILKLSGKTGELLDKIVESAPRKPRVAAQDLIFGPDDKLFITVGSGSDPTLVGEVRRCDTKTKHCDIIVPASTAGGPVQTPVYLIFRNSNPATLDYEDETKKQKQDQNE